MDESPVYAYIDAIEFGGLTGDPAEQRWRRNALDEDQRRFFIDLALDRIRLLNEEAAVLVAQIDADGSDIQSADLPPDAVAHQRSIGADSGPGVVDEQRRMREAWSASERIYVSAELRRHARELLMEIGALDGHSPEPLTSPHRMWALLAWPPGFPGLPSHATCPPEIAGSRAPSP